MLTTLIYLLGRAQHFVYSILKNVTSTYYQKQKTARLQIHKTVPLKDTYQIDHR